MIEVHDWTVVTSKDNGLVPCPKVYGRIFGHPKMNDGEFAYISLFSFDRENKIGQSMSGKIYLLKNFEPRQNMEDENKALDMIESDVC